MVPHAIFRLLIRWLQLPGFTSSRRKAVWSRSFISNECSFVHWPSRLSERLEPQVDEVAATTGVEIKTVTADAGYAYAKVYGALERRDINALIPTKAEPIKSRVPLRRFRCDAKHDIFEMPKGAYFASGSALQAWPFLLFEGEGLCSLPAQSPVSIEGTRQQSDRAQP